MDKRILGLIGVFLFLLIPGFATTPSNPLGTTVYSAVYNLPPDGSGYYYTEMLRYSDLSTTDSAVTILYIAESPGVDGEGMINGTISYLLANGTAYSDRHAQMYNLGPNPDPLSFYVTLNKGDDALITIFGPTANVSALNIVKDMNSPRVIVTANSWLDQFASGFVTLWTFETSVIDSLSTPVYLGFMVLEIIVIPTLFVLLIAWAFRKIREAFMS